MAMITMTDPGKVQSDLQKIVDRMDRMVIRIFREAGELAVRQARAKDGVGYGGRDWTDQTGNLRSSIGFGIVAHGKLVRQGGFSKVGKGDEGKQDGRDYLQQLVAKFPKGYALIVVAGREYASYVSDRGYDVLSSAEIVASDEMRALMKEIQQWK